MVRCAQGAGLIPMTTKTQQYGYRVEFIGVNYYDELDLVVKDVREEANESRADNYLISYGATFMEALREAESVVGKPLLDKCIWKPAHGLRDIGGEQYLGLEGRGMKLPVFVIVVYYFKKGA